MRPIPYCPKSLDEPAELVAAIKARRGGELLELDRMLLHSPNYADGWNTFLAKVRSELTVSSKLAELAICYVAVLNHASYELEQHSPLFLAAGGLPEQLSALTAEPLDQSIFSDSEQAVLQLTVEMTRSIEVTTETMAAAKRALASDQQVVEIVGVIAAYNMVSRFLVALHVEAE
jgi:alkylhydroperoxidase family enzyme